MEHRRWFAVPLGPRCIGAAIAAVVLALAPMASANGTDMTERPFSEGYSFDRLDDYLAHREALGPMGITWYQLQPDGTYVVVRRVPPGRQPQVVTRQELLDRYGFDE